MAVSLWFLALSPQEPDIERLIRQLGAEDYAVREPATWSLHKLGKAARPLLEMAMSSRDPEVAARADFLLDEIEFSESREIVIDDVAGTVRIGGKVMVKPGYVSCELGIFSIKIRKPFRLTGRWAWSSNFIDINNDGREDLVVANGFITTDDTGDL